MYIHNIMFVCLYVCLVLEKVCQIRKKENPQALCCSLGFTAVAFAMPSLRAGLWLEREPGVAWRHRRMTCFFPKCVAKGSRFTFWGSGGWHVFAWPCFWCPQPSAHDRREGKIAVRMGKATKTCLSWRARRCAHVVLRGRRGTLWPSMCFSRNVCARPAAEKCPCLWEKVTKNDQKRVCVRRCAHAVLRCRRGTLWHSMCFSRNVCKRPSWPWQKSCRVYGQKLCARDRRGRKVPVFMGKGTNTCLSWRVRNMCSCRFA